jgi:hypothetical protein
MSFTEFVQRQRWQIAYFSCVFMGIILLCASMGTFSWVVGERGGGDLEVHVEYGLLKQQVTSGLGADAETITTNTAGSFRKAGNAMLAFGLLAVFSMALSMGGVSYTSCQTVCYVCCYYFFRSPSPPPRPRLIPLPKPCLCFFQNKYLSNCVFALLSLSSLLPYYQSNARENLYYAFVMLAVLSTFFNFVGVIAYASTVRPVGTEQLGDSFNAAIVGGIFMMAACIMLVLNRKLHDYDRSNRLLRGARIIAANGHESSEELDEEAAQGDEVHGRPVATAAPDQNYSALSQAGSVTDSSL